jgi:hypothetical protein
MQWISEDGKARRPSLRVESVAGPFPNEAREEFHRSIFFGFQISLLQRVRCSLRGLSWVDGHASAMAPGPKDPGTIALDWETNGYPKPAIVRQPWCAEFNRPETSGVVEMVQWVPK